MRNPALRADLLMLITAAIWGSAFVAQSVGMQSIGPFLFTGLRFALGAVILLPLLLFLRASAATEAQAAEAPFNRSLLLGGTLMGLVLAVGINLQQVGLQFTSVTNSGFITGLYVIVVPLLGLLLGQKTGLGTWLGASLAVVGMFLLSVGEGFSVASGDWLQLAGAFVWGVHVLLVGTLASRHDPIRLAFIQFVVCAVISLALALALEPFELTAIGRAAPALLYGGIVAVGIGYTLQVIAQKNAIASHAAVIFSLEAVFAALAGALLLSESLAPRGYLGCALMFAGMLVAQLWSRKATLSGQPPAITKTP